MFSVLSFGREDLREKTIWAQLLIEKLCTISPDMLMT